MPTFRTTAVITDPNLGGNGTNTWHARTTAIFTDPLLATELSGLQDMIHQFYEDCATIVAGTATVTLDGEWIQVGEEEPQSFAVGPQAVAYAGSAAAMPPSQCMVVAWRTALAARRGRGRTFVGPLRTDVLQDNGTPTEAARATLAAAAADLIESSDSFGNGAIGIWSQAGVSPLTPWEGTFRDLVSATTANRFASLRSRRD